MSMDLSQPPERPWLVRTALKFPPIRIATELLYELIVNRLDLLQRDVRRVDSEVHWALENQSAQLDALVRLLESAQRNQEAVNLIPRLEKRLNILEGTLAKMIVDHQEAVRESHDRISAAGNALRADFEQARQRVVERFDHMEADVARRDTAGANLVQKSIELQLNLEQRLTQLLEARTSPYAPASPPFYLTGDYPTVSPEYGLMEHLYSYLPGGVAADIGANRGDVSACLLDAGYEVHAFEPFAPVYNGLSARLASQPRFHAHRMALGAENGEAELHLAEEVGRRDDPGASPTLFHSLLDHPLPAGLAYRGVTQVPVRTIESLHAEGVLPDELSLVKIDAEGADLDVLRGMGERTYPVVSTEFWGVETAFSGEGVKNRLPEVVDFMRERGYRWHLVLFRLWGADDVSYYANHREAPPTAWGNVFFFQEHRVFRAALEWTADVLPSARFRPKD